MPSLRFKLPNSGEITQILSQEHVTIGRRPENTIQIIDRSISGYHAEFILTDGHYRLHDLKSTNKSFVAGQPVTDFHLRASCQVTFGNVECEYDATPNPEPDAHRLTPLQLERDVTFLRGENSELLGKLEVLQRRIDILSSARLVTGKAEAPSPAASADTLKALAEERDDLRHQNTGLKLELDRLREELALTGRERDQARQALDQARAAQASLASPAPAAATQRIEIPASERDFSADLEASEVTQKFIGGQSPVAESVSFPSHQENTYARVLEKNIE